MNRRLKKPAVPAVRHPDQIYRPESRPNANDYRDNVECLSDLPIGDAGAGYRRMETVTVFGQIAENVATASLAPLNDSWVVVEAPALGQLVDRCRMKLWSVRFAGTSLLRYADGGNAKFKPIRGGNTQKSLDLDQVATFMQGWIRTDDGEFRYYDILGDRTVETYGSHMVAGIIIPESFVDIYALKSDGSEDPELNGLTLQSSVSVTISPICVNSTQSGDEVTRCAVIGAGTTGTQATFIPVPAGARRMTVSVNATAAQAAGLTGEFTWVPPRQHGDGSLFVGDNANLNSEFTAQLVTPGQSPNFFIPNAPYVRFENTGGDDVPVCLTFTKEI